MTPSSSNNASQVTINFRYLKHFQFIDVDIQYEHCPRLLTFKIGIEYYLIYTYVMEQLSNHFS